MPRSLWTIGRLSKRASVKVTTIRYYESIGLMSEPLRSPSGQRQYEECDLERLTFIRHARELGFSVESIRELILLQTMPEDTCASVDTIARKHLDEVRRRLTQLKALECELERMVNHCEGGEIASCAVLSTLANHQACIADNHDKTPQNWGK